MSKLGWCNGMAPRHRECWEVLPNGAHCECSCHAGRDVTDNDNERK